MNKDDHGYIDVIIDYLSRLRTHEFHMHPEQDHFDLILDRIRYYKKREGSSSIQACLLYGGKLYPYQEDTRFLEKINTFMDYLRKRHIFNGHASRLLGKDGNWYTVTDAELVNL